MTLRLQPFSASEVTTLWRYTNMFIIIIILIPYCELCKLPPSAPKGDRKRDFAIFGSKIQLLLKEVCCKVFFSENFQR